MTDQHEWPVVVRFVVSDNDRRAIAEHFGETGMASLKTCRRFLMQCAYADLEVAGNQEPEA